MADFSERKIMKSLVTGSVGELLEGWREDLGCEGRLLSWWAEGTCCTSQLACLPDVRASGSDKGCFKVNRTRTFTYVFIAEATRLRPARWILRHRRAWEFLSV